MLLNVITNLAAEIGGDLDSQRDKMVSLASRAAKEMHKELECNKILREVTLVVPIDKVVSLPAFIGELKGMRMHTNEIPFDVNSIGQQRYITSTLGYKFKNWRDLGEAATYIIPAAATELTLTCSEPEAEYVSVHIVGQTDSAEQDEEVVVMNNTSVQTTKLFGPQIHSIACFNNNRIHNISVKLNTDDEDEIAVLYNNQNKTRYKIVDVSQVFWSIDTNANESFIDVLYKVPATELFRDGDSFYAGDDYDEAWFNMAMYLYLKPLQNRMNDALGHRAACMDFLQSAKEGSESGIVKKMQFGRNKFYSLFNKWRYYPGSITNVDHNIQP